MHRHSPATVRKPLRDEVFNDLNVGILAGRYAAGEWLRQDEIARRLGVSMTPVREALDLLVSTGLAERVPYRGVRVLQLSQPDILDSYELRLLLEAAAVHRAASEISSSDLASLRQLLQEEGELVRLGDLPRQREISRALHGGIVAAAGNPLLHRIYLDVLKAFPDWMLYEHLYRRPELLAESVLQEHLEHELILTALEARDPAVAVRQATDHVRRRGRELELYVGIPALELASRERQVRALIPAVIDEADQLEKEQI